MRNLISALLISISGSVASADGLLDLSDPERTVLHSEIRNYLLENPEIIVEVIDLLEEKKRTQEAQDDISLIAQNADALFNDGFSYVTGNPDAVLTIVEFSDYQCGYCKRAHPDVQALLAERDDIRLIHKEFPILGPVSEVAARAALAVLKDYGPETYAEFNDTLMTHPARLNEATIDQIAGSAGVDIGKMHATMASEEISSQIQSTLALAQQMRASGTPTFVVGERVLRGYLPLEEMRILVEGELAKM